MRWLFYSIYILAILFLPLTVAYFADREVELKRSYPFYASKQEIIESLFSEKDKNKTKVEWKERGSFFRLVTLKPAKEYQLEIVSSKEGITGSINLSLEATPDLVFIHAKQKLKYPNLMSRLTRIISGQYTILDATVSAIGQKIYETN